MVNIFDIKHYKQKMLDLKASIIEKLRKYPAGELYIYSEHKKGKLYLSFRKKLPGSGQYQTITKDTLQIQKFAEKKFLEEKLRRVQHNIEQSENLILNFEDLSIQSILEKLDERLFPYLDFSKPLEFDLPSDPEAAKKIINWMAIPCPPSNYFPAELKHRTSMDFYVRTKSEVIWAEKLKQFRLPFKFELPIQIRNEVYLPDFTVMRQDGKLVYIEHCGMMIEDRTCSATQRKCRITIPSVSSPGIT